MGGFLHKLLGRSAPLPAEVQAALAELERLGQDRPSLSGSAALLQAILPALYAEPIAGNAPAISPEEGATRLAGGLPLLRGESFAGEGLERRWQRVCAAVQTRPEGEPARALSEAVKRGRLDLSELAREVLAGRPEVVHARASALDLDAALTATFLRLTLFPTLAKISAELTPLRQGAQWQHGYCPVCGSWPLLGEYRGLEQLRWLRCGLCAAEWEFPRFRCPFCATTDHEALGYFHVEGEEARYRAATCDACRGYVKMTSSLSALSGPQLLVTDLATLHLDLAAAERGYLQP